MPSDTATADGVMVEYITTWNTSWSPVIHLDGDFGGGTVTLSFKNEAGGFSDISDGGTYTAAADDVINFQRKTTLRLTLTGATAPNINWSLV